MRCFGMGVSLGDLHKGIISMRTVSNDYACYEGVFGEVFTYLIGFGSSWKPITDDHVTFAR